MILVTFTLVGGTGGGMFVFYNAIYSGGGDESEQASLLHCVNELAVCANALSPVSSNLATR